MAGAHDRVETLGSGCAYVSSFDSRLDGPARARVRVDCGFTHGGLFAVLAALLGCGADASGSSGVAVQPALSVRMSKEVWEVEKMRDRGKAKINEREYLGNLIEGTLLYRLRSSGSWDRLSHLLLLEEWLITSLLIAYGFLSSWPDEKTPPL